MSSKNDNSKPPTLENDAYFQEKKAEFEVYCDDGVADGCHSLAEMYSAVMHSYDKAGELYEKNCIERKHGGSCFNLAVLQGMFHSLLLLCLFMHI